MPKIFTPITQDMPLKITYTKYEQELISENRLQLHWPLNFGKNYQLISKTLAQTVLVNKLNSIYYVSNLILKDNFKIGLSFFSLFFIVL